MGLNENNRKILLKELEKERMIDLSEKIKKIYSVSRWGYYSNDKKKEVAMR